MIERSSILHLAPVEYGDSARQALLHDLTSYDATQPSPSTPPFPELVQIGSKRTLYKYVWVKGVKIGIQQTVPSKPYNAEVLGG